MTAKLLSEADLKRYSDIAQNWAWGHASSVASALLSHIAALTEQRDDARQEAERAKAELAAIKAPGDWPEDFAHENGRYFCECSTCGARFLGHKRRVVCKACASKAPGEAGVEELAKIAYDALHAEAARQVPQMIVYQWDKNEPMVKRRWIVAIEAVASRLTSQHRQQVAELEGKLREARTRLANAESFGTPPDLMFTAGSLRDAAWAGWYSRCAENGLAQKCRDRAREAASEELAQLRQRAEGAEGAEKERDRLRQTYSIIQTASGDHAKHYWCLIQRLKRRGKNAFDLQNWLGEGSTVAHAIWAHYEGMTLEQMNAHDEAERKKEADRDRLAAELAAAKEQLAARDGELERVRRACEPFLKYLAKRVPCETALPDSTLWVAITTDNRVELTYGDMRQLLAARDCATAPLPSSVPAAAEIKNKSIGGVTVLDPGHKYLLPSLDGGDPAVLQFVKREGAHYPGNVGSYPGTTMQAVLRALIERAHYVNNQIPCAETEAAASLMASAVVLLELRAARCHGRQLACTSVSDIVDGATCKRCGHVGCECSTVSPPAPATHPSDSPRIVCLCGSTRFMEAFQEANLRETLAGRIVLSVGCNTKSDGDLFKGADAEEIKRRLDDLHKRKIDICDEVLVLDVGGYIGESTGSEIEHAKKLGKPIRYLSQEQPATQPDSPPAFRCPKCGCKERDDECDHELRDKEPLVCGNPDCTWSGTWSEVAAAKGGEGGNATN